MTKYLMIMFQMMLIMLTMMMTMIMGRGSPQHVGLLSLSSFGNNIEDYYDDYVDDDRNDPPAACWPFQALATTSIEELKDHL